MNVVFSSESLYLIIEDLDGASHLLNLIVLFLDLIVLSIEFFNWFC
jgi:hypothetical protein